MGKDQEIYIVVADNINNGRKIYYKGDEVVSANFPNNFKSHISDGSLKKKESKSESKKS